jgi:hypothetical protein
MPNVSILSALRERAGLTPNDIAFTFTDYDQAHGIHRGLSARQSPIRLSVHRIHPAVVAEITF